MDVSSKLKRAWSWFMENRTRQLFLAVLVAVVLLRLWYFSLTGDQALWYDEGEYLIKARSYLTGMPDTGYWWGRPPLFTLVTSVFWLFGSLGEGLTRLFLVACMVGSVAVMFFLGRDLFDSEETGLIASVLVGGSWILSFLTNRILVEVPLFFLLVLSAWFFVKYDRTGKQKWFWFSMVGAMLSFLMKWTAGMLLVIFPAYVFFMRRGKFWKERHELSVFVLAAVAFVGYWLYALSQGSGVLYAFEKIKLFTLTPGEMFSVAGQQIGFLQGFTGTWFGWVVLISLLWAASVVILHYGLVFKQQKTRAMFLLLLWTVLFFVAFVFIKAWENRYVIPLLVPLYLFSSALAVDIWRRAGKEKQIVGVVILALLLVFSWGQVQEGHRLTQEKLFSYEELKDASVWIREHSVEGDAVLGAGKPQITYYSERATYDHGENLTHEMELIEELGVKYVIINSWEKSPEWTYPYFLQEGGPPGFRLVHQEIGDYYGRQVFAVVFEPI